MADEMGLLTPKIWDIVTQLQITREYFRVSLEDLIHVCFAAFPGHLLIAAGFLSVLSHHL
jgi:hypothetical protein